PAWSSSQKWNPGDIVNSNGALYQCKPFPEGSWCNVAPAYYEPHHFNFHKKMTV
ncbi:hypothetical protein MJL33_31975, partial [Salmonella enterica subsp. enterica serovar Kentucky]|nr:hypothetical protein [Salmonella enterica subsp. enterica serovar Kentucky]